MVRKTYGDIVLYWGEFFPFKILFAFFGLFDFSISKLFLSRDQSRPTSC